MRTRTYILWITVMSSSHSVCGTSLRPSLNTRQRLMIHSGKHRQHNRRASEPGYQEAGCPNSEQVSHCKVELASFVMADVGELLMSVLSTIRVPKPGDRVHKDECALSFSSPVSHFSFCKSKLQPMDSVAVLYSLPLS